MTERHGRGRDVGRQPFRAVLAAIVPLMLALLCPDLSGMAAGAASLPAWTDASFSAPPTTSLSSGCVAATCMAIEQLPDGSTALFTSTNFGGSWRQNATDFGGAALQTVACATALRCVLGANAHYFTTANGGTSWTSHANPSGIQSFATLSCLTTGACAATATTADSTTLTFSSTTSGTKWTKGATIPLWGTTGLSCTTALACTTVGWDQSVANGGGTSEHGRIYTTINGAKTWSLGLTSSNPTAFQSVSCVSTTSCVVGGGSVTGAFASRPSLYVGGPTKPWVAVTVPAQVGMVQSVSCSTSTACTAVASARSGLGAVAMSSPNAHTWTSRPLPTAITTPAFVNCSAQGKCLTLGSYAPLNTPSLATTATSTALGQPWVAGPLTLAADDLTSVSCPSSTVCAAAGDAGGIPVVEWSSDAGTTWSAKSPGLSATTLSGVSCATTAHCLVVGATRSLNADGTTALTAAAFSTADGGATWIHDPLPSAVTTLNAVSCPSPTRCIAVGYDNPTVGGGTVGAHSVIVTSGTAGATWSVVGSGTAASDLTSITCGSPTTCLALGSSPTGYAVTLASTNGGASWLFGAVDNSDSTLAAVSCASATTCYGAAPPLLSLVSAAPRLLTSTDGGLSWTSEKMLGGAASRIDALSCSAVDLCDLTASWHDPSRPAPFTFGSWTPGTPPNWNEAPLDFAAKALAPIGVGQWLAVGDPQRGTAAVSVLTS